MDTTYGPMHGIRIIDLSTVISGPLATQILGDQGADVIKVEPPGTGDLTRPMGTRRNGLSAIFAAANRNKRAIILDLKSESGVEILGELVATADVVVQNFRPGAVERMVLAMTTCAPSNRTSSMCQSPVSARQARIPHVAFTTR